MEARSSEAPPRPIRGWILAQVTNQRPAMCHGPGLGGKYLGNEDLVCNLNFQSGLRPSLMQFTVQAPSESWASWQLSLQA